MVVLRVGSELRRWVAVGAAGAVVVGLLRWGLHHSPAVPPVAQQGASAQQAGTASLQEAVVAITIDAPAGARLEPVTTALTKAALPATIFVAPGYASAHPAALRLFIQEGDEVEILADSSGASLPAAARLLAQDTGETPLFARLPGGNAGPGLLQAARLQELGIVPPGRAGLTLQQVEEAVAPGAVLTLSPALAPDVPALAAYLQARGYEAVTLEALDAIDAGAATTSLPTLP
jgi:peptidoglycan/xylan/chitin deacetylase (PgdA/CDA1 family)